MSLIAFFLARLTIIQVNSENDLAITYNDRSVLESHHSSLCFRLLRKPDCDLMVNLSALERKELRSTIIASILATDMVCHSFTVDLCR